GLEQGQRPARLHGGTSRFGEAKEMESDLDSMTGQGVRVRRGAVYVTSQLLPRRRCRRIGPAAVEGTGLVAEGSERHRATCSGGRHPNGVGTTEGLGRSVEVARVELG